MIKKFLFVLLLPLMTVLAQDSLQTFLSLSGTGVEDFLTAHPEYDGRETIIFVFDTGVDMGIDGLKKTSTGAVKVIDAQDFTGEGDINIYECETDEEDGKTYFINEDKNYKVAGADKLSLKPVDDKYYIGVLKETQLLNSSSGAEDLNGNGSTDDKYYMVAFQTKDDKGSYWVVYFDTNDNGDLSDEKPLRNYKENYDSFFIPNEKGLPKLTFALNIFPEEKKISLHFDDGAHGTHVSGIASGYHIGGTYLNGVAPGANIISCKIGNNNFSGGATVSESMKRAFLYADKISKEVKKPCIINMSFGIGSEIERRSDMEMFLADLLTKNPYLYVCFSNGNEGPGISSTGLPSSSNFALSSGAVLAKEVGRDLYGTSVDRDIILHFSSRGGEVSKPDVCSPGACTSTIPNWAGFDRFWGTSMASPYSAGVLSLILSGIHKEYPDVKIPAQLVYKAVRNSATNMEGYTVLDQGGGYINAVNAFKLLKKYIGEGEAKNFESYTTQAFAPNMPGDWAPNIYIRNGSYLKDGDTYSYFVSRNNIQNTDKFYRIYNIKSNSDWLKPVQKKTYLRNNQGTSISVKIDKSKISKPGLYVGKITAVRDDKTRIPEFEMLATVIIPYKFNSENNYTQTWKSETVETGIIKRYFIELPAGQTGMKVTFSAIPDKYIKSRFRLYNPQGIDQYTSRVLASDDSGNEIVKNFYNLEPGVYELDVEGYFEAEKPSNYNLAVEFSSIDRIGGKPLNTDNNTIKAVNLFNNPQSYRLKGEIEGYQKDYTVHLKDQDNYKMPFVLKKSEAAKEFTVSVSKEDFNKVTDFSVLIYDENGRAIRKTGLSYDNGSVSIRNNFKSDSTNLTLALIPAFATKIGNMTIHINEKTLFADPQPFSVKDGRRSSTTLYPAIEKTLQCSFSKPNYNVPGDAVIFGKINFESETTGSVDLEMPVLFNF